MCYCFRAPIRTFFFDACQMTVKSCVLEAFQILKFSSYRVARKFLQEFIFADWLFFVFCEN